jgi:hypothetical protein
VANALQRSVRAQAQQGHISTGVRHVDAISSEFEVRISAKDSNKQRRQSDVIR